MNTREERAWIQSRGYSKEFNVKVERMTPGQIHAIYMRMQEHPVKTQDDNDPTPTIETPDYTQPTLF